MYISKFVRQGDKMFSKNLRRSDIKFIFHQFVISHLQLIFLNNNYMQLSVETRLNQPSRSQVFCIWFYMVKKRKYIIINLGFFLQCEHKVRMRVGLMCKPSYDGITSSFPVLQVLLMLSKCSAMQTYVKSALCGQ